MSQCLGQLADANHRRQVLPGRIMLRRYSWQAHDRTIADLGGGCQCYMNVLARAADRLMQGRPLARVLDGAFAACGIGEGDPFGTVQMTAQRTSFVKNSKCAFSRTEEHA